MSMPEFPKPNPDFTQEQALTMILSSIALEEVALSHIINAEGEKIQYILKKTSCNDSPVYMKDMIEVNKSVANLLEIVLQNQMILKNKMDRALEFLPKPPAPPEPPCPPRPPCPPEPPCPPRPPCPPGPPWPPEPPCPPKPPCPPAPPCAPAGCDAWKHSICFGVVPKTYCCNESLLWKEENVWGRFSLTPKDCSKIQMPRTGTFAVDLYLDTGHVACSDGEVKLIVCCEDKGPVIQKISLAGCRGKRTVVQMPCSCCPCHASVLVCAPYGMQIRRGQMMFTKL